MYPIRVKLALLTTVVFWASAFVGIRYGLSAFSPGSLALLRFIVASLSMALIYARMPIKTRVCWSDRFQLLGLGMLGIGLYNICLNYGEISVSAGTASFIIGLIPAITIILSVFFLRERQGWPVWLGLGISFMGLFFISLGEKSASSMTLGVLIILVSAFLGAVYTLMSKRYLKHYHPVAVTAWVMWGGTLMLMMFLPKLLSEIVLADTGATLAVAYMGVFPAALAYVAWNYVLNHLPASNASMYLYAMPLISTILGFIFLHETPTVISLFGGCMALLGAVIANAFRRSPQAAPIPSADNKLPATA